MMKVITRAVENEHAEWKALGFEVRIVTPENIAARIAGESVFSKLSKEQVKVVIRRALLTVQRRSQNRTPEKPVEVSASGNIPSVKTDLSHASIEDLVEEIAGRMKSGLPIKRSFYVVEQLSSILDDKAASIRQEMASLREQEARFHENAMRRSHNGNGIKPHRPIGTEVMVYHSID